MNGVLDSKEVDSKQADSNFLIWINVKKSRNGIEFRILPSSNGMLSLNADVGLFFF
jgi:hypothetical protein